MSKIILCVLIVTIYFVTVQSLGGGIGKHCIIGKKRLLNGAKIAHPKECMQLACVNGELLLHQCTESLPEPNCSITPGLPGHPFPDCCGSSLCIVGRKKNF